MHSLAAAVHSDMRADQWYARQSAISPDGRVLATLWGSPLGPIERDTPISLHWWNPQARRMVLGAWINFTVVTAPSTSPAFSPDSRVLAVGSVRLDAATGAWRSHIELHGLQVVQHSSGSSGYRSSSNGTGSMTAQRLCSMVLPQELDPVTGANAVTGMLAAPWCCHAASACTLGAITSLWPMLPLQPCTQT